MLICTKGQNLDMLQKARYVIQIFTVMWHLTGIRLTSCTQALCAIFALHHAAAAVLSSVYGWGGLALAAAPVGALCPTGGPLRPLRPASIHCSDNRDVSHFTAKHSKQRWIGHDIIMQCGCICNGLKCIILQFAKFILWFVLSEFRDT